MENDFKKFININIKRQLFDNYLRLIISKYHRNKIRK